MQSLQEVVRARVDALRAANAQHTASEAALLGALCTAEAAEPLRASAPGAIHLCPWHTCAATRHG